MDFQEIGVYAVLAIAVGFLARKYIWKPKSKKNCSNDDCGCH
jgi:hypothetical protein